MAVATGERSLEIIKLLLDNGADINAEGGKYVIVKANGQPARALIDTATTGTNLISNNFCFQHGITSWQLGQPLTISLAIKGSRSKLQQEATVTLQLSIYEIPCTFRLANLDNGT